LKEEWNHEKELDTSAKGFVTGDGTLTA
jgi:hypothetical protein